MLHLLLHLFIFSDGSSCILAGWGSWKVFSKAAGNFIYESPDKLQMTPLIILKHEECQERFRLEMVSKSIICAVSQLKSSSGCRVCECLQCFSYFRLRQVRSRQVRSGQVRSVQVRLILSFLSCAN
jgi:hypothetical protein